MVWAGDAISGSQSALKGNFRNCYAPCLLWMSLVFQVAPCFAGSSSVPSPCLGVLSPKSEFELRGLLCWSGAGESKGAAKAVREIRGRAPMPDLLALASRPPAVAKPRVDVAIKPAGKAECVTKEEALGGVAVASVLPVGCGLAGGPTSLSRAKSSKRSTNTRSCTSNCDGLPLGFTEGFMQPDFHL